MPRLEYMYPGGENFIARDDAGELWLYYRYVDRGPLKFPDSTGRHRPCYPGYS